jgi:hypothetical protein
VKYSSPWAVGTLIASNLIPLAGVFWLGWDIKYLVLSYWFENLVIGGYAILRMLAARGNMAIRTPTALMVSFGFKIVMILFFLLHYGGFCGGHGFFLLALFNEGSGSSSPANNILSQAHDWPGPLVFFGMLVQVLKSIFAQHPPGIEWMIAGLTVSHGVSFATNYLGRGEYLNSSAAIEMSRPYKRIVLLHVAILAAAMPVLMLKSPLPLLILIVLGKAGLDLWLHLKEHKKTPEVEVPAF